MTRVTERDLYLYRCYDDEGVLLYLGVSWNVGRRLYEHERNSTWHRWLAELKVDGPYPVAKALELESRLIRRMAPVFNTDWNDGRRGESPQQYVARRDPATASVMSAAMAEAINSLTLPTAPTAVSA